MVERGMAMMCIAKGYPRNRTEPPRCAGAGTGPDRPGIEFCRFL